MHSITEKKQRKKQETVQQQTVSLTINQELQNLLPPLSESEYAGLEADILKNGVLSPLVTWNNTIVDGHHRHAICLKHNLPFTTIAMAFDSLDAAKLWAWQHQEHRRNLTPFQRGEIALQFKELIATKAHKNKANAGGDKKSQKAKSVSANAPEAINGIDTRVEIAKIAEVSENTISRIEYLSKHADDSTKQKLRKGDTTINAEYKRLKKEKHRKEREEQKQANIVIPQDDRINLHTATIADAVQYVAAESVDYIVTDPDCMEQSRQRLINTLSNGGQHDC